MYLGHGIFFFSAPRDIPNNVLILVKVKNDKFVNVHLLDSSAVTAMLG